MLRSDNIVVLAQAKLSGCVGPDDQNCLPIYDRLSSKANSLWAPVTRRGRWHGFAVNALTAAGAVVVTLLLLEGLFRLLPVATAPRVEPPTADNPIQRYVANSAFIWSLGWNFQGVVQGRTNAQGFVADYDYDAAATSPLVTVIGDSFVEAFAVGFRQSLTGRLQQALGTRGRAYAFAQAGSPLSQYIAYAMHACESYRPQRMVILIVGNDFDESVFATRLRNGIFHLHPRPDGGFDNVLTPLPPMRLIERIARSSALALYVFRNLGRGGLAPSLIIGKANAQAAGVGPFVGNTSADANARRVAEGEKVIDWFLGRLSDQTCLKPKDIVLAVDAMRPEVYDPARLAAARASYFGRMRAGVLAKGAARGFTVVDLEQAFAASFARDGERFEPLTDGHWNAHGHAVGAEAVLAALADWPPLSKAP